MSFAQLFIDLRNYVSDFYVIPLKTPLINPTLTIGVPLFYLCSLYLLQFFINKRGKGFDLIHLVAFHNFVSCVGSLIMFLGLLSAILIRFFETSVWDMLCDPECLHRKGDLVFWCYIFYVSKFYELLDSYFLVLRKRELTFLHVYHHSVVIPLFYIYNVFDCFGHFFLCLTNTFVHVFMYYYYTLVTYHKTVWWKKYITIGQMIQFWLDMIFTWQHLGFFYLGLKCTIVIWPIVLGHAVGFSFFLLFFELFFQTYLTIGGGRRKKIEKTE